jgi:RNA polymerase sigma factor (sigma-70 family)
MDTVTNWVNPKILRQSCVQSGLQPEQVEEESRRLSRSQYVRVTGKELAEWEGGASSPELAQLETLSEIYGCPVGQFFMDEVPTAPQPPPTQDGVLQDAVARLDDPYRQVIVLRFFGKMSCGQVAQALDLPMGTVTKRLSRAYAILREQIGFREVQA